MLLFVPAMPRRKKTEGPRIPEAPAEDLPLEEEEVLSPGGALVASSTESAKRVIDGSLPTDDLALKEGGDGDEAVVVIEVADGEVVSQVLEKEAPLDDEEKARLFTLEREVEESFYRAGRALKEIRDTKLYRQTHDTFEAYCEERFGFKRRHPYQLIDAALVAENIRELARDAHILPSNEYQLRPLVKLKDDPERQAEAWKRAVERSKGRQPTFEAVRETVSELLKSKEPGKGKKAPPVVGVPVVVKKSRDPLLSKYLGTWGIVRRVGQEGIALELYDTLLGGISDVEFEPFPSLKSEADKKRLEKVVSQLQATSSAYGNVEELVTLIVKYFARLKRSGLTDIERDVLSLLERRAKKIQEESASGGEGRGTSENSRKDETRL